MRKVASYSFSQAIDSALATNGLEKLNKIIKDWIAEKGKIQEGSTDLILSNGRRAEFVETTTTSTNGLIKEYKLTEATDSGLFQTSIFFGHDKKQLCVYAELRAGGGLNQLSPVQFDVRCPAVIRSILDSSDSWQIGETPLSTSVILFNGDNGAQRFIQVLFHPFRSLPIVVVSNYEGLSLTDHIASNIAKDLSGLAIVAVLDEQASWFLTSTKGKEWSCYNGAIRLFWPTELQGSDPYAHPLWTRSSLLYGVFDVKDASYRIRKVLRRKVIGASAFSVWEPTLFSLVRKESRREELDALTSKAETAEDWKKIADSYARDNDDLQSKVDQLVAETGELKAQVSNLQIALQWKRPELDEIRAAEEIPPTTVADAVEKAREKFRGIIVFGAQVNEGIQTLAQDAGPPEKIYQYLSLLAQMVESMKRGSLGKTVIQWLEDKGANCSGESETTRNNKTERSKRTWDDGQESRVFDTHLKPSDSTAPDRCARIYFDVDSDEKQVIVGWVGRHP